LIRDEVKDPPALFLCIHKAAMPQDRQVLGNRRWRKLEQFGNLANAQSPARQGYEGSDTAFVGQGVRDGKDFPHGFTSMVIWPDSEMYPCIRPLVKRVLGTAPFANAADPHRPLAGGAQIPYPSTPLCL
jgi:hypothetical protein